MGNSKIMAAAALSLVLLSGCSNSLPKEQVPMGDGPLSSSTPTSSASGTTSTSKAGGSANGDKTVPQSTVLPGTVDNPDQRNQHLAPNPAPTDTLPPAGTGGSGQIIDGARDSVGEGSKDDKQQAAESFIAFVNLMNSKDYAGACEYIKLTPSQGTDCLAAMDKLGAKYRDYPTGLKIDRLDNGVVKGDTAILNRLVFVYDGGKRMRDVYMFRPTDGSGKWKTNL